MEVKKLDSILIKIERTLNIPGYLLIISIFSGALRILFGTLLFSCALAMTVPAVIGLLGNRKEALLLVLAYSLHGLANIIKGIVEMTPGSLVILLIFSCGNDNRMRYPSENKNILPLSLLDNFLCDSFHLEASLLSSILERSEEFANSSGLLILKSKNKFFQNSSHHLSQTDLETIKFDLAIVCISEKIPFLLNTPSLDKFVKKFMEDEENRALLQMDSEIVKKKLYHILITEEINKLTSDEKKNIAEEQAKKFNEDEIDQAAAARSQTILNETEMGESKKLLKIKQKIYLEKYFISQIHDNFKERINKKVEMLLRKLDLLKLDDQEKKELREKATQEIILREIVKAVLHEKLQDSSDFKSFLSYLKDLPYISGKTYYLKKISTLFDEQLKNPNLVTDIKTYLTKETLDLNLLDLKAEENSETSEESSEEEPKTEDKNPVNSGSTKKQPPLNQID